MTTKTKPPRAFPDKWRAARTADDYLEVLRDMDGEINRAKERLGVLDAGRAESVFSGTDAAHARELFAVSEQIKSLDVARAEARRRCDEAIAREREATWRAWHKENREKRAPALAAAWTAFYEALATAVAKGLAVRSSRSELEDAQTTMETARRRDLLVNVALVRVEAAAKLKRPVFGANVVPPPSEDDSIAVMSRLVAEIALALGVHNDDPYRARRDSALVTMRPRKERVGSATIDVAEPTPSLVEGILDSKEVAR